MNRLEQIAAIVAGNVWDFEDVEEARGFIRLGACYGGIVFDRAPSEARICKLAKALSRTGNSEREEKKRKKEEEQQRERAKQIAIHAKYIADINKSLAAIERREKAKKVFKTLTQVCAEQTELARRSGWTEGQIMFLQQRIMSPVSSRL